MSTATASTLTGNQAPNKQSAPNQFSTNNQSSSGVGGETKGGGRQNGVEEMLVGVLPKVMQTIILILAASTEEESVLKFNITSPLQPQEKAKNTFTDQPMNLK